MLQSGMRAPMGVKVKGPDLDTIEVVALDIEALLKQVPSVKARQREHRFQASRGPPAGFRLMLARNRGIASLIHARMAVKQGSAIPTLAERRSLRSELKLGFVLDVRLEIREAVRPPGNVQLARGVSRALQQADIFGTDRQHIETHVLADDSHLRQDITVGPDRHSLRQRERHAIQMSFARHAVGRKTFLLMCPEHCVINPLRQGSKLLASVRGPSPCGD